MNKQTKDSVKFLSALIIRLLTKAFYVFPIKKNRIMFSAYDAKHVCCNPKYIFEELVREYPGEFEYVWTLPNMRELKKYKGKEKITVVPLRSLKFYYMKATSKVCVVNSASFPEIKLRKDQFQIYTHHGGGAYKTAGSAIKGNDTWYNLKKLDWDAENTSLFLSSSNYFTENVIREQKRYHGEVMSYGMPRNDMLVKHKEAALRDKIRKIYKLSPDVKIVIYAPTWRDNKKNDYEPIDIDGVINSLKKRFGGEWVFFMRTHYLEKSGGVNKDVILVTDYPDMQELLAGSDVLISDYSSSIWDYSLTGRPCLLYTPDLDLYLADRGFDTPIETWGYPVCRTNDILCDTLSNWDEKAYLKRIGDHHKALGACETGNACKKVCDRIYRVCMGKRK
ncbi:MAG: CDP-glycerol glycerophosphotransferase family protein [Ruminococcus sp.]|nr:CDP-glycerol glycerophosphotransferase family protein [Ruminococcus sp.]